MPAGGKIGNKGGGRKTAREEAQKILDMDLCNKLHNDRLDLIAIKKVEDRTDDELRMFVLPVSLRGVVAKSENTIIIPKPIDDIFKDDSIQTNKGDEEEN